MEYLNRLLLLVLLTVGLNIQAQVSFYKTYSGSAFDKAEGMTQLPDSSFAITGGSGAFSVNSGQVYLMLTDSIGNHLWTKSYGGDGSDWGRRVFHRPGIGYTIVGTTNTTSDGRYNFYFLATDEAGNLQEEKNFGTLNWEQLWDACLLDDGGLIMVGETEGESSNQKDMYIARVDASGDTLWTNVIESGEDDVAFAVDILNDTTFIIGGYSWDGTKSNSLLMSFHIDGTENWRTFYGGIASTKINDIQVYNNEIYCGGEIIQDGQNQSDWWVLKTDDQGNEIATATNDYNGDDVLTDICIVNDDDLYLALYSNSSDLNVYSGGYDAFVFKYHTALFFNGFSQGYSGENPDIINDLIVTNDEGAAFAGTCGDDRVNQSVGTAAMIAKIGPNDEVTIDADLNEDLVNVTEESMLQKIEVYPNPTSQKLFIIGGDKKLDVEIYSVSGQLIGRWEVQNVFDISNFQNGVYLLHLIDGEHRTIRRIVKR